MSGFEDVMIKRLADCHAEACEEVLASVRAGRPLGDAVLDAVESLPKSKTRGLRQWVRDWELIAEWQDKWAAAGWTLRKHGREFELYGPMPTGEKGEKLRAHVTELRGIEETERRLMEGRMRVSGTPQKYSIPESYFPPYTVLYAITGAKQIASVETGVRNNRLYGRWKSI